MTTDRGGGFGGYSGPEADFAIYDRGEPKRRRGERRAPRPLEALDSQVALIDALDTSLGSDLVKAMVDASNRAARGVQRIRLESGDDASNGAARQLAHQLNTATTIVVTDRMLDFVLNRMASIPFGDPLVPDDLLFESAYFVLPRAVTVDDITADDYTEVYPPRRVAQFDSGFYVPYAVTTVRGLHGEEVPTDGIMYVQSASVALMEAYFEGLRREAGYVRITDPKTGETASIPSTEDVAVTVRLAEIDESLRLIREKNLKHVPIYSSGIGLGVPWDPELREETFVLTPAGEFERRFWLSLLRTLKEEVFAPVRFKRADYRRAARRGLIPDVVVADLRRVKHREKTELLPTGETVMWSHRWRRRGHPRTYHRGTDREFVGWVRETICGPDSMPLIEKDRVYRLSK